jgi:hypothetical protein
MGINFHDVSVGVRRSDWNGISNDWVEYMGSHVCLSMVIDNVHDSHLSNVIRDVYDV